jgi:predicted CXXCH cytochrome family protein
MNRPVGVNLLIGCAGLAGFLACAEPLRYRVLSTFFDGVPLPAQRTQERLGYEPPPDRYGFGLAPTLVDGAGDRAELFAHAPYRENRCGACHNPTTGNLFRTPQQGLCRECHAEVTREPTYLHGPVAVDDCLFCHHPHGSAYDGLLLASPDATCARCHDREELTEGPHHATVGEQTCTACHDPHGGEDRFFLMPRGL